MALKRKAVQRLPKVARAGKVDVEADEHDENEVEEEVAGPARKIMKKPAAAASKKQAEHEEGDEEGEEEDEDTEAEEEINEEEAAAKREEEQVAARKKELKAMYVDELKKAILAAGLETGKREDMIQALLAHEAKLRAEAKAKAEKIRAVVVKKKEEFENMPAFELKALCASAGEKGVLSKTERISKLLAQWQDEDGVDKALAQMAIEERKNDLFSKGPEALLNICDRASVDPYVKEVMVERIVKRELEAGRYDRPALAEKEDAPAIEKKGDVVETLLAKESSRKQQLEAKKREEEAAAAKKKELRSMSVEDLKKRLTKKGHEAAGKKEDMVEALFVIAAEEEAVAKKKQDLLSMPLPELKQLLISKKLETSGRKTDMVDAVLAHEAKLVEDDAAYVKKVEEVLVKKREELETKTASELKELCASRSLKLGVGKNERIETLLEDAKTNGEVDKTLRGMTRDARRDELLSMQKDALTQLCKETGADPIVKEVMVERILAREIEVGEPVEDEKPASKRSRKSAK